MIFSEEKKRLLKPQKERKLITFLTAILLAVLIFAPYMIIDKGYFIFYGDFNAQQIPFYKMCHDAVRAGQFGWNTLTDLGSNFVGSYSFYLLGSPFFWLTIPFPSEAVPYLMGPLFILKFGCAAFTSYLYIRRFVRTPLAAELGALLYAFSGFSVYNIFFYHFHEAIIVFPLLLLSLELLITENKRGVFALSVALCAITNYYFFFGMVVFAFIYFFARLFSSAYKIKFSRFLTVVLEAVFGLLLSSALLLPSVAMIISNDRITSFLNGWNAVFYGKEQIYGNIIECFFFPPDLPARPLFFPSADVKWSSLGGFLPLFSMVGVISFASKNKGNSFKRIICVSMLFAFIPILNSSFSFFNTAYYARWFYMPILIMCLMTASAAEDAKNDLKTGFRYTLFITLFIALIVGFMPKVKDGITTFGLYTNAEDKGTYTVKFFIAVGIALGSLLILRILMFIKKEHLKLFLKLSIVFSAVVSVVYASSFIYFGKKISYSSENVIIPYLIEGKTSLDGDGYRIDTYSCVDNTGMYLSLPSINAFHSVVPSSVTDFYKTVGYKRSVASRPTTDLYAIRPLLSVKYLLNRITGDDFEDENGNMQMEGYRYIGTDCGYKIYENNNFIPYGFSYKYYISHTDLCSNFSEEERALIMLKAIVLQDDVAKNYDGDEENFLSVYKNKSGDESEYNIRFETTYEQMALDCEELKETSAEEFSISSDGFKASVFSKKDNSLVFFSVPYDKGFTAFVDGKKVDIIKANEGFMAVKVPYGESKIVFTYKTPFLFVGISVTAITFAVFILYLIAARAKLIKSTCYPEGERLLKKWCTEEFSKSRNEEGTKRFKPLLPDDFSVGLEDFGSIYKR